MERLAFCAEPRADGGIAGLVRLYGGDILASGGMEKEKLFLQHGGVTVFAHSFAVACLSLYLVRMLGLRVDRRALVRGALLHDYFLYDWHVTDPGHRFHGFSHPRRALENADRDFILGPIERDMIRRHMFPLTLTPPKYRESVLVCVADKLCALCETVSALGLLARLTYARPRRSATGKNRRL